MILETERLILRKLKEEDFADFCAWAADPEMCRMMGRDQISGPETARPTFDWLLYREPRSYALVLRQTGRMIGNLTIGSVPPCLAEREELRGKEGRTLSFSIARHYQRRGLMLEAVRAVIRRLFEEEKVDYIQCGHFDFNVASCQLQKKLGFELLVTDRFVQDGEEFVCMENVLWRERAARLL